MQRFTAILALLILCLAVISCHSSKPAVVTHTDTTAHPPTTASVEKPKVKEFDFSAQQNTKLGPVNAITRGSAKDEYVSKKEGYTIVPVYYGTSRKRSDDGYYGFDPNTYNTLGIINVSVPDVHVQGQVERPFTDFGGRIYNPLKYVETGKNSLMAEDQFYASLQKAITNAGEGETFVFVHGYNSTFADAAMKTAQLFYDMQYPGVPIMYSWPSKGTLTGYGWDEQQTSSTGNIRLFTQFLVDVTKRTGAKSISIVAHSMGNRLLCKALVDFSVLHPDVRFNHIVMAAPDVYRDDFKNYEAKEMLKVCKDVTLYASSNDYALSLSNMVHAGIPRLGQSGAGLFVMPPIVTVDVSTVTCNDMLGHSCYSATKCVISDIAMLLEGIPVGSLKRSLKMIVADAVADYKYWKFPVGQ